MTELCFKLHLTKKDRVEKFFPKFIPIKELAMSRYGKEVEELWKEKDRLDFVFNCGVSSLYYKSRNIHCPWVEQNKAHLNRAGNKFHEICKRFPSILNCRKFIDLCGGPGSWSSYILSHTPAHGFGLTIDTADRSKSWMSDLKENPRWEDLSCNGGDICDTRVQGVCISKGKGADLVIADGAACVEDYKKENLQELYCTRIILSELLIALAVLENEGNFVLKMFDTFTDLSKGVLYIITSMFEDVYVFKPDSSRPVNSERYIIALRFKKRCRYQHYIKILEDIHTNWVDGHIPECIAQSCSMRYDKLFHDSFTKSCSTIADHQTKIIRRIMDQVDAWMLNTPMQSSKNDKDVAMEKSSRYRPYGKRFPHMRQ